LIEQFEIDQKVFLKKKLPRNKGITKDNLVKIKLIILILRIVSFFKVKQINAGTIGG